MRDIIAGTGHRPNKLPGGYSEEARTSLVSFLVRKLEALEPVGVISGMALGFDQALAEAALELKIPLCAAIPFKGMYSKWPKQSIERFDRIMEQANSIVVVCPEFSMTAYQRRNEHMVDNCTLLLAMWDGSAGGTGNCIKYAKKIPAVKIVNLWDEATNASTS